MTDQGAQAESRRVLVAAAGTGGHVYPALAVANVLRSRGHEVAFVGGDRLEATVVPAAGYSLHRLPARGLPRRPSPGAVVAGVELVGALVKARRLLRRLGTDVVVGMGGHHSLAPALAGGWSRVPVVLHEQNANLSLAHRLSVRWAAALALSFPLASGRPVRPRCEVTGNPLREPIRRLASATDAERAAHRLVALERFGFTDGRVTVLVVGGSLGAGPVNDAVLRAAEAWGAREDLQVLHVSGPAHEDRVREAWSKIDLRATVVGYLDAIEDGYACADVVVGRSGGSVAELTACGLPAVLVPGPWSPRGDQAANARVLADAGAAVVVDERGPAFDERLGGALGPLLEDESRRRNMARAARTLGRPDAADHVANLVEEVAVRRRKAPHRSDLGSCKAS